MIVEGEKERNLKCYFDIADIKTNSFREFTKSLVQVHGDSLCFRYYENGWIDKSYEDFHNNIEKLAKFFIKKDLTKKRIIILSESRPEIIEILIACCIANTISVPIDIKLSKNEIASIIEEVDPTLIFTSSNQYELLSEVSYLLQKRISIIGINTISKQYSLSDIPNYNQVGLPSEEIHETSMIVYTSGSTGQMKGVKTSASQLLFQIRATLMLGFAEKPQKNLSMLPMNHLFEISGILSALAGGFPICVSHGLEKEQLNICFQKHNPTQLFTVPLFCKSIMKGILLNVSDSSLIKRISFQTLIFLARCIPSYQFRRFLFSPIHEKLGSQLVKIVVGGAAVDKSIIKFFNLIGISIFEGYGLTETAPTIAVNRPSQYLAGSVGPLIPGVRVKIDSETKEILTKGPHVMQGYYKNIEESNKVLSSDGWFRTGDIGYFNKDKMLHITGRLKNLIILESGKNVHPEEVLRTLSSLEFILEASVFGINKLKPKSKSSKGIALVVYLDPNFQQKSLKNYDKAAREEIEKCVESLAQYKKPSEIIISPKELPKTSSMKVKHFIVSKMYHEGKFKS